MLGTELCKWMYWGAEGNPQRIAGEHGEEGDVRITLGMVTRRWCWRDNCNTGSKLRWWCLRLCQYTSLEWVS